MSTNPSSITDNERTERERVAVTQADKEASADLAHALAISCEDFTSGAADILVQAFARHRIAALRPTDSGLVTCAACEGKPAPINDPCAVCGATALRAQGQDERAEIVAWLRGISDPGATFQDRRLAYKIAAAQFADAIEAGQHRQALDRGAK